MITAHGNLVNPRVVGVSQQNTANWDADEDLPQETLVLSIHQLGNMGFSPLNPPPRDDSAQSSKSIYLELRQRTMSHWKIGNSPILQICERPMQGNWENWQEGR
jgi:hypothetical protein